MGKSKIQTYLRLLKRCRFYTAMKIRLLLIGKTESGWLKEACEVYFRRIVHYGSFEMEILPDIKSSKNLAPADLVEKEGSKFLERISADERVYLLDEKGVQCSSREFAALIEKENLRGTRKLVFIIAGAFGASAELGKRADTLLSLSAMTFPHQLVRLIFLEQLYRAHSILRNEPYHND